MNMNPKDKADFKKFQERIQGRRDPGTIKMYTYWIKRYLSWTSDRSPESILDFDRALYEGKEKFKWLRGKTYKYSRSSRLIAMSAVKIYLMWGVGVPLSDLPTVKGNILGIKSDFQPKIYTEEEIKIIQDGACDEQCLAMLKLGYDAIMRAAEIVRVRKEDFKDNFLYVHAAKGSYSRWIELSPETLAALEPIFQERKHYLFMTYKSKGGKPFFPHSWSVHFIRNHKLENKGGWHAYARHSPITHLLNKGVPFEQVWYRARHKNPEITARYLNIVGREIPQWVPRA